MSFSPAIACVCMDCNLTIRPRDERPCDCRCATCKKPRRTSDERWLAGFDGTHGRWYCSIECRLAASGESLATFPSPRCSRCGSAYGAEYLRDGKCLPCALSETRVRFDQAPCLGGFLTTSKSLPLGGSISDGTPWPTPAPEIFGGRVAPTVETDGHRYRALWRDLRERARTTREHYAAVIADSENFRKACGISEIDPRIEELAEVDGSPPDIYAHVFDPCFCYECLGRPARRSCRIARAKKAGEDYLASVSESSERSEVSKKSESAARPRFPNPILPAIVDKRHPVTLRGLGEAAAWMSFAWFALAVACALSESGAVAAVLFIAVLNGLVAWMFEEGRWCR